jgi:hypothetical protein
MFSSDLLTTYRTPNCLRFECKGDAIRSFDLASSQFDFIDWLRRDTFRGNDVFRGRRAGGLAGGTAMPAE